MIETLLEADGSEKLEAESIILSAHSQLWFEQNREYAIMVDNYFAGGLFEEPAMKKSLQESIIDCHYSVFEEIVQGLAYINGVKNEKKKLGSRFITAGILNIAAAVAYALPASGPLLEGSGINILLGAGAGFAAISLADYVIKKNEWRRKVTSDDFVSGLKSAFYEFAARKEYFECFEKSKDHLLAFSKIEKAIEKIKQHNGQIISI